MSTVWCGAMFDTVCVTTWINIIVTGVATAYWGEVDSSTRGRPG